MGLDLTLLPFDCDSSILSFSHTVLSCERRGDLFDAIRVIEEKHGHDTPERFSCYLGIHDKETCGARGYSQVTQTPYGKRLQFLLVSELFPLFTHRDVQDDAKNRAIWAYLSQLPPDTKVALFWH